MNWNFFILLVIDDQIIVMLIHFLTIIPFFKVTYVKLDHKLMVSKLNLQHVNGGGVQSEPSRPQT